MKKTSLLAVCFGLFLFVSCQNKTTEIKEAPESEVIEDSEEEEFFDESGLDFDGAIDAFEEEDYAATAIYIDDAIDDLQVEKGGLSTEDKAKVDQSIIGLQELSNQVRKGEIKELETLENAFAHAEMTIAHDYLIITTMYTVKEPDKAKNALQRAITSMENATEILDGDAKAEADKMITDAKNLLNKGDMATNKWGNEVGMYVEKISAWLAKHAKELGIIPATDPRE